MIEVSSIEKRIRTIRLIESMGRYPGFSKKLKLEDFSYCPQRTSDERSMQERERRKNER